VVTLFYALIRYYNMAGLLVAARIVCHSLV